MWKLQILMGLEASIFSVILPGLTPCKCCFRKEQVAIQNWICTALLDTIMYFQGSVAQEKWQVIGTLETWIVFTDMLQAFSVPSNSPLCVCFPSCKTGNSIPLLEGFHMAVESRISKEVLCLKGFQGAEQPNTSTSLTHLVTELRN